MSIKRVGIVGSGIMGSGIAECAAKNGFEVAKSQIRLPNGPLKTVGEHAVAVAAHTDVVVDVTVQVVAEQD